MSKKQQHSRRTKREIKKRPRTSRFVRAVEVTAIFRANGIGHIKMRFEVLLQSGKIFKYNVNGYSRTEDLAKIRAEEYFLDSYKYVSKKKRHIRFIRTREIPDFLPPRQ